jgi:GNAT superfamily N-acetyltransferase
MLGDQSSKVLHPSTDAAFRLLWDPQFPRKYYPDFQGWWHIKVAPGLADGSRRLFVGGSECSPRGILIAKRAPQERKICTFWVHPSHRGHGIGTALLKEATSWLGTSRPLITVPEECIEDFRPLFERGQFWKAQALCSYYRLQKVEYVFNGVLPLQLYQFTKRPRAQTLDIQRELELS